MGIDPSFVRNPSDGGDGWGDDPATPDVDESANDDFGDLRLQPGSAAIDAGDNTLLPLDEFDLDEDGIVDEPLPIDFDGNPRIIGGTVDIGAYEFSASPPPEATPAAGVQRESPFGDTTADLGATDWWFDFEQFTMPTDDEARLDREAVDHLLAEISD